MIFPYDQVTIWDRYGKMSYVAYIVGLNHLLSIQVHRQMKADEYHKRVHLIEERE